MTKFEQVDEVLGSAIVRGDVPGVVAMAATRDEVIYQGAFGRRALADEAAMSTDTVFWIASMTKAITSAAAMQLVEQGELALDHEMADLLPELSAPQVLEGFDPSGQPRLRPAKRPITLRHRLTHTAGLVYDTLECRHGPVHGNEGDSRHHFMPERGAVPPARVRSRRQMGLRNQYRLGRQSGRTD